MEYLKITTGWLLVDMVKDALAWQKMSKCPFLRDIENSFHEVTGIGLETGQFFSFKNISTNRLLEVSKVSADMGHGWQAV